MLNNLKIGARLGVGYGIIVLALLVVSVFTISEIRTLTGLTDQLYAHPFTVRTALGTAQTNIIKMHRSMKDLAMAKDLPAQHAVKTTVDALEKKVYEDLEVVEAAFLGNKKRIRTVLEIFSAWKPIRDEVIILTEKGDGETAQTITTGKGAEHIKKLQAAMQELIDFADKKAADFVRTAADISSQAVFWTSALLIATLILTLVAAVFTTRSITGPITKSVRLATLMSESDFSQTLDIDRNDEIGMLVRALNTMGKNLRDQIQKITSAAQSLATSSSEISASSQQLAAATTETATSVNETTTTVEEVRQTAQLSTEKAKYVSDTAKKATEVSQHGKKATDETIESMANIKEQMDFIAESAVNLSEQSQAVGEIIASVNDLAEQSNLLAVNASIEAAKAGEQGKGFAVVAQEVKGLAGQSKQATSQVKEILNDIQKAINSTVMAAERGSKAVDEGSKKASETGEAIQTLATNIEQTTEASTQIAASSRQQLAGTEQVASAMGDVKEVSTQNMESSKLLEAEARNLSELGQELKQLVEQYKV